MGHHSNCFRLSMTPLTTTRPACQTSTKTMLARIDKTTADLRTRRGAATGEEATRLQGLEQRLAGAGGGRGGRGAGGGGAPVPVQPVRTRLTGLLNTFNMSGARTGTMAGPTGTMREILEDAKKDLAAIEREIR